MGKEKKRLAFDDDAEIIEISPRKPQKKDAAAASTTDAFGPEGEVGSTASSAMETDTIDPNAPIQFVLKESGLYASKGFLEGLPHVDQATKKLARSITNDDAASLVLRFKNVNWTQASLQRVLEVFTLAKRGTEHEEMLNV